jgi:hypothetical protein
MGTGSYPPCVNGWHLKNLRMPIIAPRAPPCNAMACSMYSEQLGLYLHVLGKNGKMTALYNTTADAAALYAILFLKRIEFFCYGFLLPQGHLFVGGHPHGPCCAWIIMPEKLPDPAFYIVPLYRIELLFPQAKDKGRRRIPVLENG